MTPMQEQYRKLKQENPDSMLFFRLGDFFEIFDEDAVQASKLLGITLTGRGKDENRTPMAGIPHHSLRNYIPKLLKEGIKVAIADQTEKAIAGKLVNRQITKILTPGTLLDLEDILPYEKNFITFIHIQTQIFYVVFVDCSTGETVLFQTESALVLKNELTKFSPKEILINKADFEKISNILKNQYTQIWEPKITLDTAKKTLEKAFSTDNLKRVGLLAELENYFIPLAKVFEYIWHCQKTISTGFSRVKVHKYTEYLEIDSDSLKNLEIIGDKNSNTSVYSFLNYTKTSMGQRTLMDWLVFPTKNKYILEERHSFVEFMAEDLIFLENIRFDLANISDIERIVSKVNIKTSHPKEIIALKIGLENSLRIFHSLFQKEKIPNRLQFLAESISKSHILEAINLISNTILESPATNINEGGIIKDEFSNEVAELRNLKTNSKQILLTIQSREIQRTGISNLRISFNRVFGYYIEVTNSRIDKVPEDYIRKQTLANSERYITEELKKLESDILNAEEKLIELEKDLYLTFLDKLQPYLNDVRNLAKAIAEIDVVANLAYLAKKHHYTKPEILKDDEQVDLNIVEGRHLIVERLVNEYTPNSTIFSEKEKIHLLTGPNMSGKSTYIRSVAINLILAHTGSFVPATEMKFKIFDKVFTRIGASDNLSAGESTFMVEMLETANILSNATKNSLVVLDEVGRGTSTYDGVAIAWSILEYIASKIRAKTLFATHYHELTKLEKKLPNLVNFRVLVKELEGKIHFLHQITKGGADKSYGVHVARLAGVPDEVIEKAEKILEKLESNSKIVSKNTKNSEIDVNQLSIFNL